MEGAAVALAVAQAGFAIEGANSANSALTIEGKQEQLAYQQKSLANYNLVQNTVDAQTAAATTRGYAMSSPSLNAIQIGTENKGAQASQNIQTESDIAQNNIATEKKNVQNTLYAKLFGDVAQAGTDAYKYSRSTPSTTSNDLFGDDDKSQGDSLGFPGGGLPNGIPQALPGTY